MRYLQEKHKRHKKGIGDAHIIEKYTHIADDSCEYMTHGLAKNVYCRVEAQLNPTRNEIIIRENRKQRFLGEKGDRIRELTSVVQKRFNFHEGSVELYAEKVASRGLYAIAQDRSLLYKPIREMAVHRECHGVLQFIMESRAN